MGGPLFVMHGHFYQPPRENPWTGLVAREPGAEPFHDWNARIDDECYRPNGYGRVMDRENRIVDVVNNYAHLSFNVGPTLLAWLQAHDRPTLQRMVEADREHARRHGGRGNAIAQAYNHVILPLADARDRATQIRWGLAVFRHHFGREAEALWLPETAADHATLDDLIDHGMRFVILAPGQAGRVRPLEGGRWRRASGIDTSEPCLYRHRDGSGRSLLVFFYDGPLAHAISFGDALRNSDRFVERAGEAAARLGHGALVHAAADGETAGHHNPWGDRVIAHALTRALPAAGYEVTSYAALVDRVAPRLEVELDLGPQGEGSSWSCAHGVGRWIRDCGCSVAHQPGWNQQWREGLRVALDGLRDAARPWFEEEAGRIFADPWAARDHYIELILDPGEAGRERFLATHARPGLDAASRRRGLVLLEMQHQLLLQYTSCGWFFDDIGGLESRQVLRYAARAVDLWEQLGGEPPESELLDRLAAARSNQPATGSGATIFRAIRSRDAVDPRRLLAIALLRADHEGTDTGRFGAWSWEVRAREQLESEAVLLHVARVRVERDPDGESREAGVVIRRAGDFDLRVWFTPDEDPAGIVAGLRAAGTADREFLVERFGPAAFDTATLVVDGARELLRPVIAGSFDRLRAEVTALVDRHGPLLATGVGEEEAGLLRTFARHARQDALAAALEARLDREGDVADLKGPMVASEIDRGRLRPVVEDFVERAIRAGRPGRAERGLAVARELEIPLYLHRAQEAWIEALRSSSDPGGLRRLGPALGFAASFGKVDPLDREVGAAPREGTGR